MLWLIAALVLAVLLGSAALYTIHARQTAVPEDAAALLESAATTPVPPPERDTFSPPSKGPDLPASVSDRFRTLVQAALDAGRGAAHCGRRLCAAGEGETCACVCDGCARIAGCFAQAKKEAVESAEIERPRSSPERAAAAFHATHRS